MVAAAWAILCSVYSLAVKDGSAFREYMILAVLWMCLVELAQPSPVRVAIHVKEAGDA
jgi:hypothetical protein